MAERSRIDGLSLGMLGAGGLLVYAGIRGKSIPSSITALIQGRSPATAAPANPISGTPVTGTGPLGSSSSSSAGGLVGAGTLYTSSQVAQLWESNGGDANTAAFAASVAMAESGGNAGVTSSNPDGGTNVGLFQLDTPGGVGAGHTVQQLQDPNLNTQITIMATRNGIDWSEWADPVVDALPGHQYTPGG